MSEREEFLGNVETGEGGGARFHILQPNRDLQSNWEVDLAKNLEEYLLKICSGEISADHDHQSFNFAEAALLLQGSIQVYSRKVEYLYSLVLHALEFLSQKRQVQQETTFTQHEGSKHPPVIEEDEIYLGLDDVPVEAKSCLEDAVCKDGSSNPFSKIPQNLLVLEGDCFDTNAEAGELESYLLATCDFYGDFLLLDPCDAGAVYDFLNDNAVGKEQSFNQRGSSVRSKNRPSIFPSPSGRSVGSAHKSGLGKNKGVDSDQIFDDNCNFESNANNLCPEAQDDQCASKDGMWHCEEPDVGCFNHLDDSEDEDDPWKPLNPHEPGNSRIKPFRKGRNFGRQVVHDDKRKTIASKFPLAKLDGPINPELAEALGEQLNEPERLRRCGSPSLYEKLRRSLVFGEEEGCGIYNDPYDEYNDTGGENGIPDFEQVDLAHNTDGMDADVPFDHEKRNNDPADYLGADKCLEGNHNSNTNLEDLCRSHLDALLASIAETEKQTELATRVSTWKQRIELTLEEQETQPPFDIHQYGGRILDRLVLEADSAANISFSDVVAGQPKHEVARTFSALLQLVNNGNVDLERPKSSSEVVCYTAENPFSIRLLCTDGNAEIEIRSSKRRVKSPLRKGCKNLSSESSLKSPRQNGRFSIKLGKGSAIRCTPEGKRRRKSRLTEPVDF